MDQIDLISGLVVAHFALFLCGMVFVAKTSLTTRTEKKRQFWFSLLVPFAGPFITIFIHWSDLVKPAKRNFPVGNPTVEHPTSDLFFAAHMSDGFGSSHTASLGHTDCGHSSDHCHS